MEYRRPWLILNFYEGKAVGIEANNATYGKN
jgi:hypothetical protein